jgi:hypothetical protein
MTRTRALVAALCAVVAMAGCSAKLSGADQPAEGGPMKIGGDSGEVCLSLNVTPGPDLTYGIEVLQNLSDKPLEITGLEAVNAQNLRVAEAFIVEVRYPHDLIGAAMEWPPVENVEKGKNAVAWRNRKPLTGYSLPPSDVRTIVKNSVVYNLVVHLQADDEATAGSIDVLAVDYKAGGKAFRAGNTTKVVVKPSCL